MHTNGEGVRQEHGLSRVRGRRTGSVWHKRVYDQQRWLFADLYRFAAHFPVRLQTRVQVDQQQHVRRSVYLLLSRTPSSSLQKTIKFPV